MRRTRKATSSRSRLDIEPLAEALASQAAVRLKTTALEAQRRLLDSFIRLIAAAIDEKSPFTGEHCQRVPAIMELFADAACENGRPIRGLRPNQEERYELHIASWLHDCGKVTVPEYVVDKATKLHTLYDRIETVRMRFEIVKRDVEISSCGARRRGHRPARLTSRVGAELAAIEDDFVLSCSRISASRKCPTRISREFMRSRKNRSLD